MAGYDRGLGSMAPARLPGAGSPVASVGLPFYGPDKPEDPDQSVGEDALQSEEAIDAIGKLIGQFNNEIDTADNGRSTKEWAWRKVEKYLAGKDVNPPPQGYTESTFFYRRLPRITQIGKAKLFKHVCPIQGRPWDVKRSARRDQNEDPHEDEKVSKLKAEIEDIQEAHDSENNSDDMCEFMSNLGTAVAVGPIQISQPHMRWNGGQEQIDPEDKLKPMWQWYDPKEVYPDPNAKKAQQLEYVHFHHVMSPHQLRSLAKSDDTFIASEIAKLLEKLGANGNWAQNLKKWEQVPNPNKQASASLAGYCVWRRIGILTAEALKDMGEKLPEAIYEETSAKIKKRLKDLDDKQRETLADSMWEIWFCDKSIIKISRRTFQPDKMPVYFIPFRRDPSSIFGIGAGESALECVEMLTNITRGIEDSLNDTSGYQAIIDASMVQNTDLKIQGRKVWIYRSKGHRGDDVNHKPVDFFSVPSNLEQLLACFKQFEAMVPICTGFLEMANGQDMGSGVRTDSMMNALWDSLEEFIKDVVGNVDRYWWKPFLRDSVEWIKAYYPHPEQYSVSADLQVHGVRGALRREIIGRKVMEFFKTLHQFGMPDWIDDVQLLKIIAEGLGIEEERAVLTPAQHVEKMDLAAKKKELMETAGNQPGSKERAHASNRDTAMELFKQAMAQGKDSLTPPIAIPAAERLFQLLGIDDQESVQAAHAIWAKMLAQQYEAAGASSPEQSAALLKPLPNPQKPQAPPQGQPAGAPQPMPGGAQ